MHKYYIDGLIILGADITCDENHNNRQNQHLPSIKGPDNVK